MSSHREAPEISKDPSADNTDVYAFVSPDKPNSVTLIANFIPFQLPYGGPNFFEFSDDVVYSIKISNAGDAVADITYEFRFTTTIRNPNTFLYNTGQITNITDETWNRPQTYSVTKVLRDGTRTVLASKYPVPPVNVGQRSTPQYGFLSRQAFKQLGNNRWVFAGQRADPFWVDLGSVFDLGALRPFNNAHLIKLPVMDGVNGLQGLNVHSIVLQVPIAELTRENYTGGDVMDARSVIGVWASTSRAKSTVFDPNTGTYSPFGDQVQVSRLGNPLFNEVLTPMARKDYWNSQQPANDSQFASYVTKPELAGLLPVLYPGVFPNLAAYDKPRNDLAAILLTGIPAGVVPGFQNFTGPVQADMLRLNTAVPPTKNPNPIGLIAGDAAGFPNGRRLTDNVTAIELRAVAGATIPLVDPSYTPDDAAKVLTDGSTPSNGTPLTRFPYVNMPGGGYQSRPGNYGSGPSQDKQFS
jgi:hypothetical protein